MVDDLRSEKNNLKYFYFTEHRDSFTQIHVGCKIIRTQGKPLYDFQNGNHTVCGTISVVGPIRSLQSTMVFRRQLIYTLIASAVPTDLDMLAIVFFDPTHDAGFAEILKNCLLDFGSEVPYSLISSLLAEFIKRDNSCIKSR